MEFDKFDDDIEMQSTNAAPVQSKYVGKQPVSKCLVISGYVFLALSLANSAYGLYIYFGVTVSAQDNIQILILSLKYLTSFVFAFLCVMLPLIICGKSDLAIGVTVPSYMFACGAQQAAASIYGAVYLSEEPSDYMLTAFWGVEVFLGLWTVFNFVGILFCSSERGKHLREIEGVTDKEVVEGRVARHKQDIQESKQRSLNL